MKMMVKINRRNRMIKKKIVKTLRIAMICMVVVALAGGAAFAAIPPDVAESQHRDAIIALFEAGVLEGSDDGLFHPTDNLTRAQACAIIVRAIKPPTAELFGTPTLTFPPSGFPDMAGYGWAERYVGFAVRHNIVTGFPDGTFKPGNNVTSNEMLTMVLRAMGLTNEEIGSNWPADFVARANQEGITAGLPQPLPELATRETAARMVFNKLDALRAIGEEMEESGEPGSPEIEEPETNGDTSWGLDNLQFANGRFNDAMTTFGGTPISRDAVIYTYGIRANYRSGMELPTNDGAYRLDTVHKFRNAVTPAFYIQTGNEITLMVLPMDAGFSGRIYGVINGISVATNGRGEQVNQIHMLVAGRQISWLTRDSSIGAPGSVDYQNGEVFELRASNGTITNAPTKAGDSASHNDFRELTPSGDWATVTAFANGIVTLDDGSMITIAEDAAIYVFNVDGTPYRVGRQGDIRADVEIRAFTLARGQIAQFITVR